MGSCVHGVGRGEEKSQKIEMGKKKQDMFRNRVLFLMGRSKGGQKGRKNERRVRRMMLTHVSGMDL